MENYFMREKDLKHFQLKIAPVINKGKKKDIYCSFTYITPNYSILILLKELLKCATRHNFRVILVIWDMSVFANTYYRRIRKEISDNEFINNKIKEIYQICSYLGFKEGDILIYKSSTLWKRFISYGQEDIYQEFYSTLVQLKVKEYAINYKAAYFIQLPINLFFSKYLHKLFPEDINEEIELVFIEEQREALYDQTRTVMNGLGITSYESPLFYILKKFHYLNYNEYEPEWNMTFADIQEIVSNVKPSKLESFEIYTLIDKEPPSININLGQLYVDLSHKIYEFLQENKRKYMETDTNPHKVVSLDNKRDLLKMGSFLRSEISLDILVRSDGTKSISKIAKELKKSIPTISTYIKKLRKAGLISIQENGNPKRLIGGIKANFDFGL